ncbi:MAG: corA [Paenibacillaceae bacterium]|nr:corA [Paenibacillaceae bacterium]
MLLYKLSTGECEEIEEIRLPGEDEVVWIHLRNAGAEEVERVLGLFACHPLLIEDCVKLNQRPKMDNYKNNSLITFFASNKDLSVRQFGIVVGANYVITVCKQSPPFLDELYSKSLRLGERMAQSGEIVYEIMDRCVDEYADNIDHVESILDRMERGIYRNPNIRIAQEVFHLKRSFHRLRRIYFDEKNVIGAITHHNFPYIGKETDAYFIDIYDHITRVIDTLEMFHESANGILEMQMNMKADRMNEIMKILTIISSIFLPLTFIVGLYGMNFKVIPELDWKYGYAYVWGLLVVIAVAMWLYYRRKKWL